MDLGDGLVHLVDAVALPFAGGRDLAYDGGYAAHLSHEAKSGRLTHILMPVCAVASLAIC